MAGITTSSEYGADFACEFGGFLRWGSRGDRGRGVRLGCIKVALIHPGANQLYLSVGKRRATHGHARRIIQSENSFDEKTIATFADDDCRTGGATFQDGGFRIEPELAHCHATEMTLGAGLLENWGDILLKRNFRGGRRAH